MARAHRFVQVDVFTDRVFGGNPLAVFFDADGLDDGTMQAIAREMNLSETVFLLPPSHPEYAARLRIFTPAREIPFAGHPTIGTAWVLATHGLLPADQRAATLEEGIGPVSIRLEGDPRQPSFVWLADRPPAFGATFDDRAGFSRALGLAESDLLPDAPIVVGSTGNPKLYIPLRDRATVDRAALDVAALLPLFGDQARQGLYIFAPDPDPAARRVYGRMFAPHTSGVPEDPATGSAVGALASYLVRHGLVQDAPQLTIVCEQGTKMGRQSFLHIHLSPGDGDTRAIEVGGGTVPVLEGTLTL
jgi:trans-2,3-dihydro-3-hydroxyanthranilate isomerase